jgi:hypothetical protein
MERVCIIGLDEPESTQIRERIDTPVIAYEHLPRIIVRDGSLLSSSAQFGRRNS